MRSTRLFKLVLLVQVTLFISCSNYHARIVNTLETGLIAYYPFNGNANDESGNGLNGVVIGAILSENRNGIKESAYYFDGLDDYIEVENIRSSQFESDFAISIWCKFSDFINNYPNIVSGENNYLSIAGTGPVYSQDTSKIGAYQGVNNRADYRRIPSMLTESKLDTGIYYNIIFMRQSDSAFIYLNGIRENGVAVKNIIPVIEGNHLLIGTGYRKETKQSFRGVIDEIAIYKRALTTHEIAQLSARNTILD